MTGTDPTRIPLAALLSPIAGLVATGYVAIFVAISIGGSVADETSRETRTQIVAAHPA